MNKAPLTSRTNQKLSGTAPSRYINKILQEGLITEDKLKAVLDTHWINYQTLVLGDFDEFFYQRAVHLLDAIEEAMGKRIQGRNSEEVHAVFGRALMHAPTIIVGDNN